MRARTSSRPREQMVEADWLLRGPSPQYDRPAVSLEMTVGLVVVVGRPGRWALLVRRPGVGPGPAPHLPAAMDTPGARAGRWRDPAQRLIWGGGVGVFLAFWLLRVAQRVDEVGQNSFLWRESRTGQK